MTDFCFIDTGDCWVIISDSLKYRKEAHPQVLLIDGKIADVGCQSGSMPPGGRFINPFSAADFDQDLAEGVIRFYLNDVMKKSKSSLLSQLVRSFFRPKL